MKFIKISTATVKLFLLVALGYPSSSSHALDILGYWDFNDPSDPVVASDVTGGSPDLEFIGGASYTPEGDGFSDAAGDYALDLGGVNDGSLAQTLEGDHLNSAFENNAMSVAFWQNTTQTGNTSSFWIHSPAAGANDRGFQAHTPWSNGTIFFDQSGCCGAAQRLTVAGLVQLEQWQHYVFQRDADGNMEIWVDGVQQASQGGAEPLDEFNGIITIGAEGPTQANSMAGRIDDFAIFNEALTEDQIVTLAGGNSPLALIDTSDDDDDGLPDIWEEKYAGNLTDLSGVATVLEDEISFGGPITDEASMGVSTDINYTHAMSGHTAVTINGVTFEALRPNQYPENFDYENFRHEAGNGALIGGDPMSQALRAFWNPTTGGVTSSEIRKMMDAFFANGAGGDGSNEDIRLSGLTPGQAYEFRFYHRPLGPTGSLPPNFGESYADCIMKFTTGGNSKSISYDIAEASKPPINMANNHQVFYLSYKYTAGDDGKLVLNVKTPKVVPNWWVKQSSSSPHIFALSNQEIEGGASGDFDGDGLTDLDEYEETKTDPTKADTDSDGLSDGVETNTGTFVGVTNTGTDPKNSDTDGDGLADGVETKTGLLIDEGNTGTDPNNADTDGDGYTDGGEISGGTDPNDENSKGAIPQPFLYVDFEAEAEDMSENANNGEVDGDVTFDVAGAEGGSTPTTGASFNGGHIDFLDIDMNAMIRDFEDGSYTFSCWLKPIGSAGDQGFIWGQTDQGIHNGIRNGGLLHSAHWGADWNASTVLEAEQWVHAAWTYDGVNDIATIYLNGEIDGGPQAQRAANGGGSFVLGARNNGDIPYNGEIDDVAIWREALPQGSIQALADGTSPIGATNEDSDGDGLPDSWEEKYGIDDPEGDDDNDGLTNADELENRTKPNKADSDDDGLNDKVEITDTKTNPLRADTDKDGLLDGVESNTGIFVSNTNTGTDPNEEDTDEDGFNDSFEIAEGSDPNNKSSVPNVPLITLLGTGTAALLQNDLTDPENDGVEGPTEVGPPQTAGTGFNWISINASEENYFSGQGGSEGAFDLFDNTTGGGAAKWCCSGAPQWVTVEFEEAVSLSHFVVAASNDTISHNRAPLDWGIYGSNDGENFEPIFEQSSDEVIWKADEEVYRFDLTSPSDAYTFIKYDVTRTNGNAHEIGEIEYFGELGAGSFLEITEITYQKSTNEIEMTWNSREGKTYGIFYSLNLEDFDADVDDGIIAEGDTTTYTFENPEPSQDKIFFRVMRMDE